jgi:murein DD-endopeptidase MepM/ murein hydrolase activator NlpD
MANASTTRNANLAARFRKFFTTRDFIFHDGRDLRRFSIAGRTQAVFAGVAALTLLCSFYGVIQLAMGAIVVSGVAGPNTSPEAQMSMMRDQVEKMQADVAAAKEAAKLHAARVEAQQALIAAVVSGKGDRSKISALLPAASARTSAVAEEVLAPLRNLETRQLAMAVRARALGEARFEATAAHLRSLGLSPDRFVSVPTQAAMGGPYEPVDTNDAAAADADAQFHSLFLTWQKLDSIDQASISIPSMEPVDHVSFTSFFGVRVDPFRGTAAMHPGVDIPGAIGTPIYATADGLVTRAGSTTGGYGNMVQIDHGRGIQTLYGHMSKVLVAENVRVHRGELIGLMGSTGRSTGSHLHYEVRVDGKAVNPMPFLQTGEYVATPVQTAAAGSARAAD